jgi:hypothetical protein
MSNDSDGSKFKESLGGFFHDILRSAGITMTPGNSAERIRQIGERMATSIQHAARGEAIKVIRKLQEAVSAGFLGLEHQLNRAKNVIDQHNTLIGNILEENKNLREEAAILRERVLALEQRPTTEPERSHLTGMP